MSIWEPLDCIIVLNNLNYLKLKDYIDDLLGMCTK